jgi:hypothetical protein
MLAKSVNGPGFSPINRQISNPNIPSDSTASIFFCAGEKILAAEVKHSGFLNFLIHEENFTR